jgi:arylsulfatase A-like enzyme
MLDVLFITIDSLRADHIGSLGYERETTPYLDRFAETAVLYENATAHGPTTFTSFPSIFIGKHAYTHDNFPALSGTTVAKRFNEVGYHTCSVTANAWTSPTYDYDRGFEDTHTFGRGPRMANGFWDRARHRVGDTIGNGLTFDAIKSIYDTIHSTASGNQTQEDRIHDVVIDHINKDDPTFTWAHYMTTHTPYKPDPSAGSYFGTNLPEEKSIKKLTGQARSESETLSTTNRTLLMYL